MNTAYVLRGAAGQTIEDETNHHLLGLLMPQHRECARDVDTVLQNWGSANMHSTYPFMVGGVACASAANYQKLKMVQACADTWNVLANGKITIDTLNAFRGAAAVVPQLMLPKSPLLNVQRALPGMIEAVDQATQLLTFTINDTPPPGIFALTTGLIDVHALVVALVTHRFMSCVASLDTDGFTLADVGRAVAWGNYLGGKPTDAITKARSTLKVHIASCARTNTPVPQCDAVSAMVKLWGYTPKTK
tara:strand:- start:1443 stop:2183 length:741 start_codon:yes stop_codon:yes gene_type:complete